MAASWPRSAFRLRPEALDAQASAVGRTLEMAAGPTMSSRQQARRYRRSSAAAPSAGSMTVSACPAVPLAGSDERSYSAIPERAVDLLVLIAARAFVSRSRCHRQPAHFQSFGVSGWISNR